MSWAAVLEVIAEELGPDLAAAVDRAVRSRLRGLRLTIPTRRPLTPETVHQAAPHRPRLAAKALDIHPSTAYRILRVRRMLIR